MGSAFLSARQTELEIDIYLATTQKNIDTSLADLLACFVLLKKQVENDRAADKKESENLIGSIDQLKDCVVLCMPPISPSKAHASVLNPTDKAIVYIEDQIVEKFTELEYLLLAFNERLVEKLNLFRRQLTTPQKFTPKEKKEMRRNEAQLRKIVKESGKLLSGF
jgi:hypothetical protein